MQITKSEELLKLIDNQFIGEMPKLSNSQINFNGKNNILICEENVSLWNCTLDFNQDNSILYLSSNSFDYHFNISINGNNVCFIGRNNYFNGLLNIILSESKNVIIGDECLFSNGITIRTSDVHLIYNTKTKERMNYSKSVHIGDHIWLGQNATILKGTHIGSGAIIGADSVLSNKRIPSNTTFAGNPARLIHKDTFWVGYSVHPWDKKTTEKYSKYDSDIFIYTQDNNSLEFEDIEYELENISNLDDKIEYIGLNFLMSNKNRFSLK